MIRILVPAFVVALTGTAAAQSYPNLAKDDLDAPVTYIATLKK